MTTTHELIGLPLACFLTGLSPDSLRRLWGRGEFPRPVKVLRCLRWDRKIVEDWIAAKLEAARQQQQPAEALASA